MKITEIGRKNISKIKPMWEELNKLHGTLSTHFKEHFSTFTFEERQKQIEKKESIAIFVAENGDQPVGYCIASVDGKVGEIDSIYINPEHRNKDIGETLISEAENWLRNKGTTKIHISVAEGNESVFGFYHNQGYQKRFTVFEKKA